MNNPRGKLLLMLIAIIASCETARAGGEPNRDRFARRRVGR